MKSENGSFDASRLQTIAAEQRLDIKRGWMRGCGESGYRGAQLPAQPPMLPEIRLRETNRVWPWSSRKVKSPTNVSEVLQANSNSSYRRFYSITAC